MSLFVISVTLISTIECRSLPLFSDNIENMILFLYSNDKQNREIGFPNDVPFRSQVINYTILVLVIILMSVVIFLCCCILVHICCRTQYNETIRVSPSELILVGAKPSDLKAIGITATKMRRSGATDEQMKQLGFTTTNSSKEKSKSSQKSTEGEKQKPKEKITSHSNKAKPLPQKLGDKPKDNLKDKLKEKIVSEENIKMRSSLHSKQSSLQSKTDSIPKTTTALKDKDNNSMVSNSATKKQTALKIVDDYKSTEMSPTNES